MEDIHMKKTAQTVISADKYYTITAANGKVVEVADYNTENGAAIQLWDYAGEDWQQWSFVRAGDGVYRIRNRFTGKMLDLIAGGVVDGTWVHQWEGANGSSQLWVLESTGDGRVKIKSNLSGKCLDVVGMSNDNGAALQIWSDVNGDNQFWTIAEVTRKPKTSAKAAAAKEAANMVDLDSDPTKILEVVEIGKQLLITRGSLTTFSIANDIAKYFAIIPAMFQAAIPQLQVLNLMGLATPNSAILSALIFNAIIIPCLIPLAMKGVKYRPMSSGKMLTRNMMIYGLGGVVTPFIGIKIIDMIIAPVLTAMGI